MQVVAKAERPHISYQTAQPGGHLWNCKLQALTQTQALVLLRKVQMLRVYLEIMYFHKHKKVGCCLVFVLFFVLFCFKDPSTVTS